MNQGVTTKAAVLAVILGTTAIGLVALGGAIALACLNQPVPAPLWAIAPASLTGLFGLLGSTHSTVSASDVVPPQIPTAVAPPLGVKFQQTP